MVALAGPVVAGLAILVGRVLGAQLGELGGVLAAVAIAIALAFAIHRWRPIGVATFFVFGFVGAMNAAVGNSFELLHSGEHVLGAHVGEVESWRDHQRVTFADGGTRRELGGTAGHVSGRNDSRNTTTYHFCDATRSCRSTGHRARRSGSGRSPTAGPRRPTRRRRFIP